MSAMSLTGYWRAALCFFGWHDWTQWLEGTTQWRFCKRDFDYKARHCGAREYRRAKL
jgi:hypothetical protein